MTVSYNRQTLEDIMAPNDLDKLTDLTDNKLELIFKYEALITIENLLNRISDDDSKSYFAHLCLAHFVTVISLNLTNSSIKVSEASISMEFNKNSLKDREFWCISSYGLRIYEQLKRIPKILFSTNYNQHRRPRR